MGRPVTCVSGKITYRTYRKAIVALDRIRARRQKLPRGLVPYRNENGVYRCRVCAHWHLTSL